MPFDFELNESKRLVQSRAWGELTDDDLLAHLKRVTELFEQGVLNAAWGHLADFTEVQNWDGVTTSGVRQMAERNPWPRKSARVFIVPSNITYGLSRMYQMLGEKKTDGLVLVRSVAEAEESIRKARGDCNEAT